MSAYVVVEFTVKDPEAYRDNYAGNAETTAKEHSPEYQELIEVRGRAMDARFSLLDGLPG